MSTFLHDLKYVLRQFRKHTFANVVIVLTIAMLIAAVSVIYASILGYQKQRAPFPEANRLVKLWRTGERTTDLFPGGIYIALSERLKSLAEVGALVRSDPKTLIEDGNANMYEARSVSVNMLPLAGISPLKGRLFDEGDVEAGGDRPVILSEQIWRGKLTADPNIIGRRLRLSDEWHVVVGVVPAPMRSTHLANDVDIWLPRRFQDEARDLEVFGRLKPGVSLAQAKAEMNVVASRLEKIETQNELGRVADRLGLRGGTLTPIGKSLYAGSKESLFIVLLGTAMITCVVGISCFNVTNLLLARVIGRSSELAIRSALGAGHSRIMRLVFTESLFLSTLGGIAGLLVSWWAIDALRWANSVPVTFDVRLYGVAIGGVVLLGMFVGLLPALRAVRRDLTRTLKEGRSSMGLSYRHRLRNCLVSAEVAMAVILCVVAALMGRVHFGLHDGKLGFEPEKMTCIRVQPRDDLYPQRRHKRSYVERALQALQEAPGVESVAIKASLRRVGSAASQPLTLAATGGSEEVALTAGVHYGSEKLPEMYGMDLVRGRGLSPEAASVIGEALVNETFVRKHLSAFEPIGRQLSVGYTPAGQERHWRTIVGVVRDRHPLTSSRLIGSEVFLDYRESASLDSVVLLTKTQVDAKAVALTLREVLQRLDEAQPVGQPVSITEELAINGSEPKEVMWLLGVLGSIGLLIASIGIHAVVVYGVQERTHEIGVRLALGAGRGTVLKMMVWQGVRLISFGMVPGMIIGSLLSLGLQQEMMKIKLSPFDPLTYMTVMGMLAFAGFTASFFPARRAATLKPMEALRYE